MVFPFGSDTLPAAVQSTLLNASEDMIFFCPSFLGLPNVPGLVVLSDTQPGGPILDWSALHFQQNCTPFRSCSEHMLQNLEENYNYNYIYN